jgi:hypothetical protein
VTGLTVPVAVTERTIGPRVTEAVTILVPDDRPERKYTSAIRIIAADATIHTLSLNGRNFIAACSIMILKRRIFQ